MEIEGNIIELELVKEDMVPLYTVGVKGTLGLTSTTTGRGRGRGRRPVSTEVPLKSLDEIVEERGIVQPPRWSRRTDDDDGNNNNNSLPITGGRRRAAPEIADADQEWSPPKVVLHQSKQATGARNRSSPKTTITTTENVDPWNSSLDEIAAAFMERDDIPKIDPMTFTLEDIAKFKKQSAEASVAVRTTLDPLTSSLDDICRARRAQNRETVVPPPKKVAPVSSFLDPMTSTLDAIAEERGLGKSPSGNGGGGGGKSRQARFKQDKRKLDEYEGMDIDEGEQESAHLGGKGKGRGRGFAKARAELDGEATGTGDDDGPKQKRLCVGKPNVLTAHRAVGFLAENGMIVSLRIGKLEDEKADRARLWRCEVSCGNITGRCECERKTVAREIACREFLECLRKEYPLGKIPHYEISSELLIDPRIFKQIEVKAGEAGIECAQEMSIELTRNPDNLRSVYNYFCTYSVGNLEFKGQHAMMEIAKLKAAKKAFEYLSEGPLAPTLYFTGEDCKAETAYNLLETEVYQTIDFDEKKDEKDFPKGKFLSWMEDKEETMRVLARRKQFEDREKAKKEEEEKRRFMPVDVSALKGTGGEVTITIAGTTGQDSQANAEGVYRKY